ncbi:hypothetical protein F4809DRAFT_612803 [Biscogniauxia mediterranea]|nr:hypothetical protein F4809DRAFT_612803 [Biscogniauxia mediterranea]
MAPAISMMSFQINNWNSPWLSLRLEAYTYGNAGQSIYHAANMSMTSLVERRRLLDQAATVTNIGLVVDVGYVARSDRLGTNIREHLRSQFYTLLPRLISTTYSFKA